MGVTGVKPGVLLDERLTGTPTLCLLRKSGTRVLDRLRLLVKSTFQHTQNAEAAASFCRETSRGGADLPFRVRRATDVYRVGAVYRAPGKDCFGR